MEKKKFPNLENYAIANTLVQVGLTEIMRYFNNQDISIIDVTTDVVILSLSNYGLNYISDDFLESQISYNGKTSNFRKAFYPLSSNLFYSLYNNMLYENSYVTSFALFTPVMIAETVFSD
jgi:hypothetical protein